MPACAEPDSFWSDADKPLEQVSDTVPSTHDPMPAKLLPMMKAPAGEAPAPSADLDMTPTRSTPPAVTEGASKPVAVPSAATSTPLAGPAKAAVKAEGVDPEPDAVITPPTHSSSDPLDALTPPHDLAPKGGPAAGAPASVAVPATGSTAPTAGTGAASPAAEGGATDGAAKPVQQAQEPLAPQNAALKAAIDKLASAELKGAHVATRRKEREALAFFYAARGFAPLWSVDGKQVAAVQPVLARLAEAAEDALTMSGAPKSLRTEGTSEEIAESDLALSEAVVSYARQASGSRVDPLSISPLIGLKRDLADASETLETVVAAGAGAGDRLQAFNPVEPRYVALREKLQSLRAPHGDMAGATMIPQGPTLRIGMHDARVPLLRTRFSVEVSYDEGDGDPTRYDKAVAAAVTEFQRANGLPPSGMLTKRTVAALSGAGQTSRQQGTIIANMEMWRWMPRTLAPNHIEVNVPDYVVTVFRDGVVDTRHRVVVGKTDTPTPLFTNAMKYLIVNPYWNVPQSIIKKEMLPKGGGSLSYLQGRGYSVGYHDGMAVVKQLPGDKNALGRIKFLFPNDYSVYLHDTPSKSLFAASKRAFSHGCVRVDQPFSFAESVLNDAAPADGGKHWSEAKLEGMIGDKERYINLAQPLPIVIEYFTASVERDTGRLALHEDVYGYAHAVASALGQESEPAPAAEPHKASPVVAEGHKAAPVIERAARNRVASTRMPTYEHVRRAIPPARTADAEPVSPMRSFFGAIFDPR